MNASARIRAEDLETYERDGVACLRAVLDPHWLEPLARGVDKDIVSPGPLHTRQNAPGEPGFFLTDFCLAQRIPEVREFVLASPAAEIAARIMRSHRASFFYDALWAKSAGTPKRTRWHQDQAFYPVDGDQFCVLWMPLDPVPKEACLELVRGSHRWGRWFTPELTRDAGDLYGASSGPFERMPDIEANRADYDIVAFDMQPGDCIAFHAMTVHGAPGNPSQERRRRALSTLWMGDDTVFATRPGVVRPLFEGHGLAPGDPMDCGHFPRVWPPAPLEVLLAAPRFTDPRFRASICRDGERFTLDGCPS